MALNPYRNDFYELLDILKALLGPAGPERAGSRILESLACETEEGYLNERAAFFKEELGRNPGYGPLFAKAWESWCKKGACGTCPIAKFCNREILRRRSGFDPHAPVIMDLFCGAGGLSLGFCQEGYITSFANDIEKCCLETYAHNHPEVPRENILLGDIREIENSRLDGMLRFPDVDVIVGGPPCQGFSAANRQRVDNDPRNTLYKNFIGVVRHIRPKFFVMENVKGMLSRAPQVAGDFRSVGYAVDCAVLNARDFGVPQNRERLFFIGNRLGLDNKAIFEEVKAEGRTRPKAILSDALFGLRPLKASDKKNDTASKSEESGSVVEAAMAEGNAYLELINQGRTSPIAYNHKARYNNKRDIEIYSRLEPGDRSDDPKIADIMPYKSRSAIFKDKYFKLEPDKVCKTITAHMKFDCNMYIHPNQARGLTPREAARVQSFPDDYFFKGPYTKTYMQVGNSVPPLLSRAVAKTIKKYL